jgi:hypothetical protein
VKQTIIWDLGLDFQTKKNKSYKELIFGVRMSNKKFTKKNKSYKELIFGVRMSNKKFEHHVTNSNIV